MACATPKQCTVREYGQTRLQIPFGILLAKYYGITCQKSNKRNIMRLLHFVRTGNAVFIFDNLCIEFVLCFRLLRLQGVQLLSAAGNRGIRHRCNQIPADRAYIKLHFSHIANDRLVRTQSPREQFFQIHPVHGGKFCKQSNIRRSPTAFSFRNRFGNVQFFCQLRLCKMFFFAQSVNQTADFFRIHPHFLLFRSDYA